MCLPILYEWKSNVLNPVYIYTILNSISFYLGVLRKLLSLNELTCTQTKPKLVKRTWIERYVIIARQCSDLLLILAHLWRIHLLIRAASSSASLYSIPMATAIKTWSIFINLTFKMSGVRFVFSRYYSRNNTLFPTIGFSYVGYRLTILIYYFLK